MKTKVEMLKSKYDGLVCTVAGDYLFKCLCGFAEILDSAAKPEALNPDHLSIAMAVGMKNGAVIHLTNQITNVFISETGNVVRIQLKDLRNEIDADNVIIFSLNDVSFINSLDIVAAKQRDEAKQAAREAETKNKETKTKEKESKK